MSEEETKASEGEKAVPTRMRLVGENVRKTEFPGGSIGSSALEVEDDFTEYYKSGLRDAMALEPPYNLRRLQQLTQENNTLGPCIESYVTNIDQLGYDFEHKDMQVENKAEDDAVKQLKEFFDEVWPGESFRTQREELRRDIESLGNGYLEIIRNLNNKIVFVRRLDALMMRLVKLDDPVAVDREIVRNGETMTAKVHLRERRYVQKINGTNVVFFRDFGSSRQVDKKNGAWESSKKKVPPTERGNEIIHFRCLPDALTPYGIPRWVGQLPSVLGSRLAEEFNLDFFNSGGIPPALIILQGGMLQADTRRALEDIMSGKAKDNQRVRVLEAEATGGSIDKATPVRVTVERFGGDRTKDSMFEEYDAKCEMRIRRAFRLPGMFIGQSQDASYATAYVNHTLTEAQVFRPEKEKFDEVITNTIIRDLGFKDYRMRTRPLTLEDINAKMAALQLVKDDPRLSDEDYVRNLNEVTNMKFDLVPEDKRRLPPGNGNGQAAGGSRATDNVTDQGGSKGGNPQSREATPSDQPVSDRSALSRSDNTGEDQSYVDLALTTLEASRGRDFALLGKCLAEVILMNPAEQDRFMKSCARIQFSRPELDPEGLGELAVCTAGILSREQAA